MTPEEIHAQKLESDSIVASCNCMTKSPDIQYHKPGCKYRLISERDAAREQVRQLREALEEWLTNDEKAEQALQEMGVPAGPEHHVITKARAALSLSNP